MLLRSAHEHKAKPQIGKCSCIDLNIEYWVVFADGLISLFTFLHTAYLISFLLQTDSISLTTPDSSTHQCSPKVVIMKQSRQSLILLICALLALCNNVRFSMLHRSNSSPPKAWLIKTRNASNNVRNYYYLHTHRMQRQSALKNTIWLVQGLVPIMT